MGKREKKRIATFLIVVIITPSSYERFPKVVWEAYNEENCILFA